MKWPLQPDSLPRTSWPKSDLEEVGHCPICGDERRTLLHESLSDVMYQAPGVWKLYQCSTCRGAYLDPRPTTQSIGRAYQVYHTHVQPPEGGSGGGRSTARRALRNGYLNSALRANLSPSSRLGKWLVPLMPSKRDEIDYSVRHLIPSGEQPGGTLLDIGCGSGGFLRVASELGWEAWGTEFDPAAANVARRYSKHVLLGDGWQNNLPKNYFDVVTMAHVIEHFHDPVNALRAAFASLKPGGVLWLATPNIESIGHQRFGRHWRGLEPPRHLAIFSHDMLADALARAGFLPPKVRGRYPGAIGYFHASSIYADSTSGQLGTRPPLQLRLAAGIADMICMFRPRKMEEIVVTAIKP